MQQFDSKLLQQTEAEQCLSCSSKKSQKKRDAEITGKTE